jgi:hypothetical protein
MSAESRFALRPRLAHESEPDLTRIVVAHRAIRADLARLAVCRGETEQPGSPPHAAAWRYTAALLAQIRAHNDGEDEILWPVAAAAAGPALDLAMLTDDRRVVEALLSRAGARAGARPSQVTSPKERSQDELPRNDS